MKTALILADDEKGLEKVYGVPAVRRLVLLARQLGFDDICLISREMSLMAVLSDLMEPGSFHYAPRESDVRQEIREFNFEGDEYILLLRANHVVDRWSLAGLIEAGGNHEIALLENAGTDKNEAIFFGKASRLQFLLESLQSPEVLRTDIGVDVAHIEARFGLPALVDGNGKHTKAVEAALTAAVGEATWDRDSLLYRHASRHISRLISSRIARTAMTANMVTFLNVLIGLAGAFLLSLGGYLPQFAGSFIFLFSTIVDLADGEVARLKLQETTFGHYFDITCDNIVHVAIFVGTALGLTRETGNAVFLNLLWVFLGGLILCAIILNRILAEQNAGLRNSRLAVRLEALLNNRDFAYLMALAAIFHRLDWFFVASVFGAYLVAAILCVARFISKPSLERTSHS